MTPSNPSAPYSSLFFEKDFHPETVRFFKGRKVAVTGGSGFIGSHVVEQLVRMGAQPVVISRHASPPFLKNVMSQIEVKTCDLLDKTQTQKSLAGCGAVLNLAAQ